MRLRTFLLESIIPHKQRHWVVREKRQAMRPVNKLGGHRTPKVYRHPYALDFATHIRVSEPAYFASSPGHRPVGAYGSPGADNLAAAPIAQPKTASYWSWRSGRIPRSETAKGLRSERRVR